MVTMIPIQILDEVVYVLHSAYVLGKAKNPTIISPAMDK